jgi:hypothetical protein
MLAIGAITETRSEQRKIYSSQPLKADAHENVIRIAAPPISRWE